MAAYGAADYGPALTEVPMVMSNIKVAFILFLSILCNSVYANTNSCVISENEVSRLMNLSFPEFDQTMEKGWRKYGEKKGCYLQTALLLDNYYLKYKNLLQNWQLRILVWHAGQMYAFHGDH